MISRSDIRTETFSENGGKRLIWQGFSPETGVYRRFSVTVNRVPQPAVMSRRRSGVTPGLTQHFVTVFPCLNSLGSAFTGILGKRRICWLALAVGSWSVGAAGFGSGAPERPRQDARDTFRPVHDTGDEMAQRMKDERSHARCSLMRPDNDAKCTSS